MPAKSELNLSIFIRLFFALFLIIGLITFFSISSTNSTNRLAHTLTVKNNIHNLLEAIQNAETGQRGYIITGDASYLEPYSKAKENYLQISNQVKTSIEEHDDQLSRLNDIDKLAKFKFDKMETSISFIQKGQQEKAVKLVKNDVGKVYMDQIRELVQEMIDVEDQLYIKYQKTFRFWKYGIFLLIGISVIVICLSLYNLYRKVRPLFKDLHKTQSSLTNANANLSETLATLKKTHHEKENETVKKEEVIKQNEKLIRELKVKQMYLDRLSDIAGHDIQSSLYTILSNLEGMEQNGAVEPSVIQANIDLIKELINKTNVLTEKFEQHNT